MIYRYIKISTNPARICLWNVEIGSEFFNFKIKLLYFYFHALDLSILCLITTEINNFWPFLYS